MVKSNRPMKRFQSQIPTLWSCMFPSMQLGHFTSLILSSIKPHSKFEYQSEIEELKQRISQGEVEERLKYIKKD